MTVSSHQYLYNSIMAGSKMEVIFDTQEQYDSTRVIMLQKFARSRDWAQKLGMPTAMFDSQYIRVKKKQKSGVEGIIGVFELAPIQEKQASAVTRLIRIINDE